MSFDETPIRSVLPSGLQVITHKIGKEGIIAGHIQLAVGAAHAAKINPRYMGLPHFSEHIVHNGASRKYAADEVRNDIAEQLFFDPNAITGLHDTHHLATFGPNHGIIGQVLPRRNFWAALEAVVDGVYFPKFDTPTVNRERSRILTEIAENLTQLRIDNAKFYAQLFGTDHMGYIGLGTKEQVEGYSKNDLTDYQNMAVTTRNTAVVIVGDIDHKEAVDRLSKIFSEVPNGDYELPVLEFNHVQRGEFRRHTDGANEGLVEATLHFPAFNLKHESFVATYIAIPALSKIVADEVQNKFGLYSTWLSYNGWSTGLPSIRLGLTTGDKKIAPDALAFAVEVVQDPKTIDLLSQKHKRLIGRKINDIEIDQTPIEQTTIGLHSINVLNAPFLSDADMIARYKRVTPEQIAQAVHHINSSHAFLEVRGHPDALDAIPPLEMVEAWRSKPSEPASRAPIAQPAVLPPPR